MNLRKNNNKTTKLPSWLTQYDKNVNPFSIMTDDNFPNIYIINMRSNLVARLEVISFENNYYPAMFIVNSPQIVTMENFIIDEYKLYNNTTDTKLHEYIIKTLNTDGNKVFISNKDFITTMVYLKSKYENILE